MVRGRRGCITFEEVYLGVGQNAVSIVLGILCNSWLAEQE